MIACSVNVSVGTRPWQESGHFGRPAKQERCFAKLICFAKHGRRTLTLRATISMRRYALGEKLRNMELTLKVAKSCICALYSTM